MSVYQASATATEYHCLLRVQYHLLHLCLEHSLKLLDGVSPALSTELVFALRSVSRAFSTIASIGRRKPRVLPISNHLFHVRLVTSLMPYFSNPDPNPNLFRSSSDFPAANASTNFCRYEIESLTSVDLAKYQSVAGIAKT